MKKTLYLLAILASLMFVSTGCTPKTEAPVTEELSTDAPAVEVTDTLSVDTTSN